ncbi:MAG: acetate--CoA ligase family protein [archaeon]
MEQKAKTFNLDKLFNPRSLVVVGASNTIGKVGYAIIKNLINSKFAGEIIPINKHEENIQGLKAYSSISNAKRRIDAAIIAVPAEYVVEVLKECANNKIKNAVIITAGFSETGEKGKKIEEEMKKIIEENNMVVVGPNTLGIINAQIGLNASFSQTFPLQGDIAVVSQSGALCTAILDWAKQERVGFSKFISTGNKTFLNEKHYFDYLEKDKSTKAVLVYMESVKEPKAFLKHAARLAKVKPVVVLKAGRTKSGIKAANSHTGAMSVDDEIFSIACKKANLIRVGEIQSFFDMAKLLAKLKRAKGFRLAVVTNAGGPGVIAADACDLYKFPLPTFTKKTLDAVKEINPNPSNPLDLIGDAKPIDYRTALRMLQMDSNIDIVYTLLTPQSMTDPAKVAEIVAALDIHKPIICSFIGGSAVAKPRIYLKEHGIAEFDTPEIGIKALSRLKEYYSQKNNKEIFENDKHYAPSKNLISLNNKKLDLEQSYKLLNSFGIKTPKTIFLSKSDSFKKLKIQFPVAIKAATGIAHKTDKKLVKANIKYLEELEKYAQEMFSQLLNLGEEQKIAVQEMISGDEVLVSAITTEFGKVITYGLGGIFVEVVRDYSQKIAPLSEKDILEMLSEVKGTKVLMGARTKQKSDVASLKKVIFALSNIALTHKEIKEIELNPLIVTKNGCFAVDAVVSIE